MLLDDWKEHKKEEIRPSLLWEYNLNEKNWNWNNMASIVIQRVLERGFDSDFYAMYQLYGGKENIRKLLMTKVKYLEPMEINFACFLFNLKKEDLYCYKRIQLKNQLINS